MTVECAVVPLTDSPGSCHLYGTLHVPNFTPYSSYNFKDLQLPLSGKSVLADAKCRSHPLKDFSQDGSQLRLTLQKQHVTQQGIVMRDVDFELKQRSKRTRLRRSDELCGRLVTRRRRCRCFAISPIIHSAPKKCSSRHFTCHLLSDICNADYRERTGTEWLVLGVGVRASVSIRVRVSG